MANDTEDFGQEIASPSNVRKFLDRTAGLLNAGESPFVQSTGNLLFDKDFVGIPFVFTSEPQFRTIQGGKFGPREVAQCWVRSVDPETGDTSDAEKAQFSGRYILNQIRRMTRNDLSMYVYTLAENAAMPRTPSGKFPLMLRLYSAEMESESDDGGAWEPQDDDVFFEQPARTNGHKASAPAPEAPAKRGRGRPPKTPAR